MAGTGDYHEAVRELLEAATPITSLEELNEWPSAGQWMLRVIQAADKVRAAERVQAACILEDTDDEARPNYEAMCDRLLAAMGSWAPGEQFALGVVMGYVVRLERQLGRFVSMNTGRLDQLLTRLNNLADKWLDTAGRLHLSTHEQSEVFSRCSLELQSELRRSSATTTVKRRDTP